MPGCVGQTGNVGPGTVSSRENASLAGAGGSRRWATVERCSPDGAKERDGHGTTGRAVVVSADKPLTDAQRHRGLRVLLATTFLTWAGFFAVIPLISVQYVDRLGWAASSVGLALAIRQFVQQASTALTGALADRLGAKRLIAAGMALRVASFLVLAIADSFPLLLISVILAALGGGLFESPKAAAIAALTLDRERPRFYAIAGVVGGIGVTLGTQTGALLIDTDFAIVSLVAAACFAVASLLVLLILPPVRVATGSHGVTGGLALALRDRLFVRFNTLMAGYWFVWTQLYISLPLAAAAIAGTASGVAWIYAVNSIVTIVLGYPLPRLAGRWLSPYASLALGVALVALGVGAIALAGGVPVLLGGVFIMSLGVVLTRPAEQTVTAGLADPAARGAYFGVAALSVAIGGGLGNYIGGVAYDLGERHDLPALPWLSFAAIGLIAAAGLTRLAPSVTRRISPEPEVGT